MKTSTTSRTTAAVALFKSFVVALLMSACTDANSPFASEDSTGPSTFADKAPGGQGWGPETPNFNLQAILHGENGSFGLVKFRQPNDDDLIVYLDVWVRGLQPNTNYELQRAVDTNLDGNCTSTSWLTLGQGLTPFSIVTDDKGTGSAALFRSVAAFPVGSTFDIHFRVVNQTTMEGTLASDCYRFTISQ